MLVSCQQWHHAKDGMTWREARATTFGCMHVLRIELVYGLLDNVYKCKPGVLSTACLKEAPKSTFAIQPIEASLFK
jgi:hypothetical protein